MFKPSTAPRWKIAINVLRRPLLAVWPRIVRSRNPGAESPAPTLANATLPDLRKNLRFIFISLLPLKLRSPQDETDCFSHRVVHVRVDSWTLSSWSIQLRSHLVRLFGTIWRSRNANHSRLIDL